MDMQQTPSLDKIYNEAWLSLQRGASDPKHAFHWPVLGTTGKDIALRKVVLRGASRHGATLRCYSDYRTGKIEDLLHTPKAVWLFYDREHKIQLRAEGLTVIHHKNENARDVWDKIPAENRRDYTGPIAPGTLTQDYEPNLAGPFRSGEPTRENTASGFENFAIVETALYRLEYLQLRKEGHIRCLFEKERPSGGWTQSWLAP